MLRALWNYPRMFLQVLSVLVFCLTTSIPASAQITGLEAQERLRGLTWEELCAIEDCSQFPQGYATYVFGSEVYYFPQGTKKQAGVSPARIVEWSDDDDIVRSFGNTTNLIVSKCCDLLLSHYGLADDFPDFPIRRGNRMPPAWTIISSYDRPHPDNTTARRFGISSTEPVSISEVIADDQASYDEDFWLLSVGEPNEIGVRGFGLLSKRPLLSGHHVYAACGTMCTFSTLSFAEDIDNKKPHVSLRWMTLTKKNKFLCAPEKLESGCDPAHEVFDDVPRMLDLLDDMFEAAQVHPGDRK